MINKGIKSIKQNGLLAGSLLAGFLMSTVFLFEWYRVAILKKIENYPFGGEGPVPYYYKTAELYSKVNFSQGIIFLSLTVLGLWALIRNKRKTGLFISVLIIASIFILLIQGQIDPK